ncbi:hypothetical protein CYMTET_10152 [Cymbomonas tetramitiformis]|uniref:Uncharacterized protein n=1 Tax=Cymbomonas tetramitiformis TaxID=36881 RepID=A0AAE0LEA7_9CHLO|nr:hypothetical protein CYMTET_10152 [Cymbomonas tetramitiformis]
MWELQPFSGAVRLDRDLLRFQYEEHYGDVRVIFRQYVLDTISPTKVLEVLDRVGIRSLGPQAHVPPSLSLPVPPPDTTTVHTPAPPPQSSRVHRLRLGPLVAPCVWAHTSTGWSSYYTDVQQGEGLGGVTTRPVVKPSLASSSLSCDPPIEPLRTNRPALELVIRELYYWYPDGCLVPSSSSTLDPFTDSAQHFKDSLMRYGHLLYVRYREPLYEHFLDSESELQESCRHGHRMNFVSKSHQFKRDNHPSCYEQVDRSQADLERSALAGVLEGPLHYEPWAVTQIGSIYLPEKDKFRNVWDGRFSGVNRAMAPATARYDYLEDVLSL